jgi:uncharacterized protein
MVTTIDYTGLADASPTLPSPYHPGERALQLNANVVEEADRRGRKMLTPQLAVQQQSFFSSTPFVVTSTIDSEGQPWAGLITGKPGFIEAEGDGVSLRLDLATANNNTAVAANNGGKVGLLAIEFESRRRNRLNATVASADDQHWQLSSDQGYGNCPKYINPRPWNADLFSQTFLPENDSVLNDSDKELIARCDTFFIATHSGPAQADATTMANAWGNDISHRGGDAGFLRLENDQLVFEDFPGNNMFNTLGNLQQYPFCGILLIDFDTGELLQLAGQGRVETTEADRQTRVRITSIRRWRGEWGS